MANLRQVRRGYDMPGEMYEAEGIYILCWILVLLLGISISIIGILLRKKIRMEFVYLMVTGGVLVDFLVLLWGCVFWIVDFW